MKWIIKIAATILFLSALICHIFISSINVDSITIILLILCILPWIFDYIKSLEISGIGKIELVKEYEKKAIMEATENIGLSNKVNFDSKYSFTRYIEEDPKLALAGLRMELEDSLTKLANRNFLVIKNYGISSLVRELYEKQYISGNERALIMDMVGILNRAVHNKLNEYDKDNATWVFNYGTILLDSLNEKIY